MFVDNNTPFRAYLAPDVIVSLITKEPKDEEFFARACRGEIVLVVSKFGLWEALAALGTRTVDTVRLAWLLRIAEFVDDGVGIEEYVMHLDRAERICQHARGE